MSVTIDLLPRGAAGTAFTERRATVTLAVCNTRHILSVFLIDAKDDRLREAVGLFQKVGPVPRNGL